MFTIHSMNSISIQIEETSEKRDYEDLVNKEILEKYGEEIESR